MMEATRGAAPGVALRSAPMRRFAQRSGLIVFLALGLALFASRAHALNAEVDEEEAQAEETLPSYAGTDLPHDDYDPKEAAHPVRIVAYGLHPVGVALDWVIVRPAVWVVRHEPFRTIFGFED